jgi:metal-responsive CopG/Arc/MetJ family transcriptional regulator
MTDKPKIRIVVDEDAAIVAKIDAIAEAESISRSDNLRRAIRRWSFYAPKLHFRCIAEVSELATLVEA